MGTQSEAKPFKSRFTGGVEHWLTPTQYLAENMVARMARRDKVDLPPYFWKNPKWARHFAIQARLAAGLLGLYSVEAIVRALRTKEGARAFSFGAKFLDPLFKVEQERLNRQAAALAAPPQSQPVEPPVPNEAPRPAFVQPTQLSKLKGL